MKTKPQMLAPSEKTEGQLQAQAWITWLETKQAKICTQDYAKGPYLENRLWAAFMAGYEAARTAPKEPQSPDLGKP